MKSDVLNQFFKSKAGFGDEIVDENMRLWRIDKGLI
jgi:hypothetical protein